MNFNNIFEDTEEEIVFNEEIKRLKRRKFSPYNQFRDLILELSIEESLFFSIPFTEENGENENTIITNRKYLAYGGFILRYKKEFPSKQLYCLFERDIEGNPGLRITRLK